VYAERHWHQLHICTGRQPQVVSHVDETPSRVDDFSKIPGVAKRDRHFGERRVIWQRTRRLGVHD